MKEDKRRPVSTALTDRSNLEIVKDLVESKERSKSTGEKAREAKIHYRTYEAGRRRDENEGRYGRRKRY